MSDTKFIAIVDDHTMFRKGLRQLIDLFPNYKVLFDAGNGEQLIEHLKAGEVPDILLLDIAMPGMDGYITANWVKANYPSIKVLALSTMESESAIIKMIQHGAKGYILKDAEPSELKLAFDEVTKMGYYYNDIVSRRIVQSVNRLSETGDQISVFAKLTDRELTFLKLICSEKTYAQVAREMFVSERTVDGYRESLFKKLNMSSRVGLVMYAMRNGLC